MGTEAGLTWTVLPHSCSPALKVTVFWDGSRRECLQAAGPRLSSAALTMRPLPNKSRCTITTSCASWHCTSTGFCNPPWGLEWDREWESSPHSQELASLLAGSQRGGAEAAGAAQSSARRRRIWERIPKNPCDAQRGKRGASRRVYMEQPTPSLSLPLEFQGRP